MGVVTPQGGFRLWVSGLRCIRRATCRSHVAAERGHKSDSDTKPSSKHRLEVPNHTQSKPSNIGSDVLCTASTAVRNLDLRFRT